MARLAPRLDEPQPMDEPAGILLTSNQWLAVASSLMLSTRELEIVRCVVDGQSTASIARQLRISAHTVHTHFDRVYRKLKVNTRAALVVRVFQEHLSLPNRTALRDEGSPAKVTSELQAD